jgi:hypothetical protein
MIVFYFYKLVHKVGESGIQGANILAALAVPRRMKIYFRNIYRKNGFRGDI